MAAKNEAYCLVLGGGGAKGVYHIGAWKALRELGVPVNAFVGNSIGAIIAGFLAQGAYDELEKIGDTITVDTILKLPAALVKNGELKLGNDALGSIFKIITEGKGLDTSPLRRTLEGVIDEDALRRTGNDLGVVTVSAANLAPSEVFLESMEKGTLVDYLMASSAFPGFAMSKIDGKNYLDGGLSNNVPYDMARKRGYKNIIVLDISGAGIVKQADISGSRTVYIKNSIRMGAEFDFSRKFLDEYRLLGYLDTKKAFGALDGWAYFVKPDPAAERRFSAFVAKKISPEPILAAWSGAVPEKMRHDRRRLLRLMDCCASILALPRIAEYTYAGLAAAIAEKKAGEDARIAEFTALAEKSGRKVFDEVVVAAIKEKRFDASPYYYHRLVEAMAGGKTRAVLDRILAGLHPELAAGLQYLDVGFLL